MCGEIGNADGRWGCGWRSEIVIRAENKKAAQRAAFDSNSGGECVL
jgi:hypothetical protein